jgi:hypothetical protein
MTMTDREEAFGELPPNTYLWCLHCERTYLNGQHRIERKRNGRTLEEYQMCPYPDCDGDAVIDSWLWNRVIEYHPEYPLKPQPGVVYQR